MPPLALNLKLLSDRCLVNNQLLSSLLTAVFIGLGELIRKRFKVKSNSGIVFNPLKAHMCAKACSNLRIAVKQEEGGRKSESGSVGQALPSAGKAVF